MQVTLHFVRHGQTMFNSEDKIQGWGDSFLTPEGIVGVERLGQHWRSYGQTFDRVYSSDSGRTLQTARTIIGQMGARHDVIPMEGLREYNFGYFEGNDHLELEKALRGKNVSMKDLLTRPDTVINMIAELDREKRGEEANAWFSETSDVYVARLVQAVNQIVNESLNLGHKDVLIVSHGMSIAFILGALCPDFGKEGKLSKLPNASVSTATYHNGKYDILTFGEVKA